MNRELRKIHDHADAARQHTTLRDHAILTAVEHGESLRTVADAAGLSHTAIAKIVARTPAPPWPLIEVLAKEIPETP